MQPSCYSFDVYDTCVVRNLAQPTDLFYLIFQTVLQDHHHPVTEEVVSELVGARIAAENQARQYLHNQEDLDIYKIYQHFPLVRWALDPDLVLATELALEVQAVSPIIQIRSKIQTLRQAGHKILFISDMYLPADRIQAMLIDHHLAIPTDPVYVSGSLGFTKGSGNLFRYVLQQEGLQPQQLHHTGDNIHADVVVPRSLGMRASHFTVCRLNRYEQATLTSTAATPLVRSQLAGAIRTTRLARPVSAPGQGQSQEPALQGLVELAAGVIAPLLTSYVAWVLQNAQKEGIERLYFVSRDGQILLKIARQLSQFMPAPECRYLYGSRQAWFLPSLKISSQKIDRQDLDWLVLKQHSTAPRHLLAKLEIEPAEVAARLEQFQFDQASLDRQLDAAGVERFWQMIETPEVTRLIQQKVATAYGRTQAYFHQEGLQTDSKWAMVDVGWTLKCQRSLTQLSGQPVLGYYLCVLRHRLPSTEAGNYRAFLVQDLSSKIYPTQTEQIFKHISLIEQVFTMADHPTVLGYQPQGDRLLPILKSEPFHPERATIVETLHRTILSYAEEIARAGLLDHHLPSLKQIALKNAITCFHQPTVQDVRPIAHLTSGYDQNEARLRPVARAIGLADLPYFAARLIGLIPPRDFSAGFSWVEGSIALSSLPIRWLFRLFTGVKWAIVTWQPVWLYQGRYRLVQLKTQLKKSLRG